VRFKISKYFDHVFISSDTRVLKPDHAAFVIVQKATRMKPSRMVLLDDERSNVQAAMDWGAHGILFENPYEAEVALRNALKYSRPAYTQRYSGILLATSAGALILSRRDIRRGIANPGRLSAFGGRAKRGETSLACAVRELREEAGLDYSQDEFRHLAAFWWPMPNGGWEHCDYFLVSNVGIDDVHVREGQVFEVRWPHDALLQDLTVLPRLVIERFLPRFLGQPPR
jgi:8-oxo-dGTP pyrophosphatase MutT (NUDIX family)